MPKLSSIAAIATLLLLSANRVHAQSAAFAAISGRAFDPSGAAVPEATVRATNVETGIARRTETTSEGLYRFDNLPSGIYDLTLEAKSFVKAEAKNVKLQVGDYLDINFNLKLAGQPQSVTVTTDVPLVETTKTDVSTVIDDKDTADFSFLGLRRAGSREPGRRRSI